ncbi:MAG: hypothetical protein ACLP5V_06265, partial [Candidatus Bathyarchaeia archaeon]
ANTRSRNAVLPFKAADMINPPAPSRFQPRQISPQVILDFRNGAVFVLQRIQHQEYDSQLIHQAGLAHGMLHKNPAVTP